MNLAEAIRAGVGELWAYKARTILQTLGVALGSASFIITVALIQGGREQDRNWMEGTGGVTKMQVIQKTSGRMRWWGWGRDLGLSLDDLESIEAAVEPLGAIMGAQQNVPGRATAFGQRARSNIAGSEPERLSLDGRSIKYGRYITEADLKAAAPVAVVGTTVARDLFAAEDVVGMEIQIVPESWHNTAGRIPNRYIIVGVLDTKEYYWDGDEEGRNALEWMNREVHIPLTAALYREVGKREVSNVYIKAPSLLDVHKVKTAVEGELHHLRRGQNNFAVLSQAERLQEWEQRSMVYEAAIGGAGAISLLVGGIVIMNILLASFNQRVREVGLRKALGARDSEIFIQFVIESILVAGTGGLAGTVLGVSLASTVSSMMRNPVVVTPFVIAVGMIVAVGTGVVFGVYPGIRAAILSPVRALQYE